MTALALETPQEEPQKRGFRSLGFGAVPRASLLAEVADLVDAGKLEVYVNRTFPLQQAQAAMEHRFATKVPGKVVLKII